MLISNQKLSDEEWATIKNHPTEGKNIVSRIRGMEHIGQIIEQHHERYDGKGYPNGLSGDEIQPLARILTLADSFDAMTNNRPYQRKKSVMEALGEIERCKGSQFDPEYADMFIRIIRDTADEAMIEKTETAS